MLVEKLSRLAHRIKITLGQLLWPSLNFLYEKQIGSASRLRQAFPSLHASSEYSSTLLVEPSPYVFSEPKYFVSGSLAEQYLQRYKVSGGKKETAFGPAGIVSLKDVSVSLPTGMHLWKGQVFDEALLDPLLLTNPKYLLDLESIPFRKKKRIEEPLVLLSMPWYHNPYHWLIEILPRLFLYEKDNEISNLRLVVPSSAPDLARESLKLAGYFDKVLFLDDGVYQFDQLHLLTRLSPSSLASPIALGWLNNNLKQPKSYKKRRVYVSRSDAKYRFVTNEVEVENLLSEFGFEKILMSEYSLQEKIQIFQDAEMILGSSGAGFTGMAFMEPGSLFIEFFPEGHFHDCFYHIASIGNIEYGFLVGRKDGLGFSIDTNQLQLMMEKVISNGAVRKGF